MSDQTSPKSGITYRADTDTYHLHHDWLGETELGTTILLAVQSITGEDVADQEPLSHYVDPEALSNLFTPGAEYDYQRPGVATFAYGSHSVTVRATGDVIIDLDTWSADGESGSVDETPESDADRGSDADREVDRVGVRPGASSPESGEEPEEEVADD